MIVNDEAGEMEAIAVHVRYYCGICLERLMKMTQDVSQYSQFSIYI
jgi:hypothetical protein